MWQWKRSIENVLRVCIAWYKRERGWENSRQLCKPETKSRVCITVENFPNPSRVYIRLCKLRKKVFYCFYKIFLKINSTNEGKLSINFLIQKYFLNTRSRLSSFLVTNQNAHLITHGPMKFRAAKVKSEFKFSPASKRASCKWKRYQLWNFLNLWEKYLKFGENRRNIQKIYDSVRKKLQDECHCAWSRLKVTRSCPIWQSEKMVEKLNRSICLVKFCWLGIIA